MAPKNPLRDLTPTESDVDSSSSSSGGENLREKASDTSSKPDGASAQTSASSQEGGSKGTSKGGETLREKAVKKLHGPNANPSLLGDPTSLKAETSENVPKPSEEGAHGKGRSSKL